MVKANHAWSNSARNEYQANHYFIPLHLIYVSSNHLYYGIILGLILPLGSWDVKLLSCFPIKAVAVKCNPWLHFTRK